MKRRIVRLLLALILFMTVFSFALGEKGYELVMNTSEDKGKLTVRFLWLGETGVKEKSGDSSILTSPDGKVMVIDAGHPSAGKEVIKALKAMGISKIDYLVASHPHIDHVGGFPEVINNFEIGALYTSKVTYDSSSYYNAYLKTAKEKGLEHIFLEEGDQIAFGEKVVVDIYHPGKEIIYPEDYPEKSTTFLNNHSLVMKFTYEDSTFLFAGDLYTGGEKEVVAKHGEKLKSDVHKVNHHGANTSSSKKWRDAVDMKIAVMIHEGIADVEIIKRYNKNESTLYHTLLDGTVKVATVGDGNYEVTAEKKRETDMFDKK